jgi:transcriptional regulator with XRE-family HTH domain
MDVGATLRNAREEKGLSLDRLSRVTHITLPILKAIEQNARGAIPPRPYGRGFVRTYAREVGLDPEQVVRDFFSQFTLPAEPAPAPPAAPARPHLVDQRSAQPVALMLTWGLAAVVAVAIVGGAFHRAASPGTVGTSGASPPAAAATVGRTAPPAEPTLNRAGVTIALEATGPSWVSAHVDGRRVIYRTLQPGEREVLHARQEIRIRTGDAGALRWQIDRGNAEPMGNPGEVRTARVTPH